MCCCVWTGVCVLPADKLVPHNEGFSWPWPHVESEKARIKRLRKEQEEQQDNSRQG